jgi:hypothetical protein
MSSIFWLLLALISFFVAALKPVNAVYYLRTLLVAFLFTMLTAYLDEDTKSITQLYSSGYLFIGVLYTFNIAGLVSLLRYLEIKAPLSYVCLMVVTLSIQMFYIYTGFQSTDITEIIYDSLFIFTYLAIVYFISGWVNRYIGDRNKMAAIPV